MGQKSNLERRLWRGSLMGHGLIFTVFWALAFYNLVFALPYNFSPGYIFLILFWIPILIAHVAAYFHYLRRPDSVEMERQAYREGFADGMRERGSTHNADDTGRLGIDDVGELVHESPETEKRKREFR